MMPFMSGSMGCRGRNPIGSLGKESAIYYPVSEGGREAFRATG
jgi:hypothetical protein